MESTEHDVRYVTEVNYSYRLEKGYKSLIPIMLVFKGSTLQLIAKKPDTSRVVLL